MFRGRRVLISVDTRVRCSWNICHNGGTCWKKGPSITCDCPSDYSGRHCEGKESFLTISSSQL